MYAVHRIRFLTTGAVLVTALAIGAVLLTGFRVVVTEQQRSALEQLVQSATQRLGTALVELQNDVRVIANLPQSRAVVQGAATGDERLAEREQLSQVFERMSQSKAYQKQIRLLGRDGRELVRVNRLDGRVWRTPAQDLQDKSSRSYFQEAIATAPEQVYLSSITLNREGGIIEEPHRPMLRAAVRIDDGAGRPLGVAVVNLHFGVLLASLFDLDRDGRALYVTNDRGDYLWHPDADMRFGFELGDRHRLQDTHPEFAGLLDGDDDTYVELLDGGGLFSGRVLGFRRLPLGAGPPDRFVLVGFESSGEEIARGGVEVFQQVALVTLVLVVGALALSLLTGRWQTRPLQTLTRAAERLQAGEQIPELPMKLGDEVGELARAFRRMADEIQRNEAALQQSNLRLERANEDLEHFVHIAAHDLREPLRKQRNLIDLVHGETDAAARQQLLALVSQCSREMQSMFDDFRELTRVEEGNLVRAPTDLVALIERALAPHRDEIARRGVRVRIEPVPFEPEVYPKLVERLYQNLIQNALRHTPVDGFELAFTVGEEPGRGWVFGVRNTGSSIPASKLADAFKMFRKSAESEGSGVGLSIAKKVVDRHRGRIRVESERDSVQFRFTFQEESDGRTHP
jgi:signal transduction histidine kinase